MLEFFASVPKEPDEALLQTMAHIGTQLGRVFERLRRVEQELRRAKLATEQRNDELEQALRQLKTAQEQLIVQEKLASLGALTAGIAHEIKNPLNFVINFAQLAGDLLSELAEELAKQKDLFPRAVSENVNDLLTNLEQNFGKIREHGKRANNIVGGMLLSTVLNLVFVTIFRLFTEAQMADVGFDMLAALGFGKSEIEAANVHCCGAMTLEGAPGLKDEHLAHISAVNYSNAKRNPLAQTRNWFMSESHAQTESKFNMVIGGRIKVSDCSQVTDGSAEIFLASEKYATEWAKRRGLKLADIPRILGWGHHTAPLEFDVKVAESREDEYILPHTRQTIVAASARIQTGKARRDRQRMLGAQATRGRTTAVIRTPASSPVRRLTTRWRHSFLPIVWPSRAKRKAWRIIKISTAAAAATRTGSGVPSVNARTYGMNRSRQSTVVAAARLPGDAAAGPARRSSGPLTRGRRSAGGG